MDYFLLFGLMGFGCLIIGFLGYKFYTEKIIKDQETEIAQLRTENRRLQAALRGKQYVKSMKMSSEPATGIQRPVITIANNVPDYKEW